MLEENYMDLKQQYEKLEANWNAVVSKTSPDLLA
jgi:archaellum component FlaC